MKSLLAALTLAASLAPMAHASSYGVGVHNCRADFPTFYHEVLGDGHKVIGKTGSADTFEGFLVRWNSGQVVAILTGPVRSEGKVQWCIVASETLAPATATAAQK